MTKRLIKLLPLLILIFTSNTLYAEPIKIGDSLPEMEFIDQHDQSHKLGSDIQYLIFAHTKQSGSIMTEILMDVEADHLQKHNAVYIADISGMPSLIARLFALPKLRKVGSPIYLCKENELVAWIPKKEEMITLLKLSNGTVEQISFTDNEDVIRKILEIQ